MSVENETPIADSPAGRVEVGRRHVGSRLSLLVFLVLLVGSALYVFPFHDRGWIPHDDGTLAQSADRVANGAVPHRDYDEGYTGLLTYLHAAAFRLLGTSLHTLRLVLFAAFLLFVPAVYAISRRVVPPLSAALVTFACVVWTVPNYFASMPSWYNLFLAVFGSWALVRHVETGRLRWLFLAGLWGGLSILIKIVGLYYVAAILLFLAWREQTLVSAPGGSRSEVRSRAFTWAKTLIAILFVAVVAVTFRSRRGFVDLLHFVLPPAAVALLLVREEWRDGRGLFVDRVRGLVRLTFPFLAGVLVPIAVFVSFYARLGAVRTLLDGILLRSQRQLLSGTLPFIEKSTLLAVVPYAALLLFPGWLANRPRRFAIPGMAAVLVLLLWAARTQTVYDWIWIAARTMDVVLVLVGSVVLAKRYSETNPLRRQQLFLLIALAACIGLVQFPFSAPIYFCYAVPFTILGLAFFVQVEAGRILWAHALVLAFAIAFGLLILNPGYLYFLGRAPGKYVADGRLSIPRGGLQIGAKDARDYAELIPFVQEKAGRFRIYAGPEAPEVYFLSGKPNPTRILFEGASGITPSGDTVTLVRLFERDDLKVVVWNRRPEFTHGLWRVYRDRLNERFPHSREIGKFTVMWRE